MPDVNGASSSEAAEEKQTSSTTSEAATETAGENDAEQLGSKAEARIRQLVAQNKEIKSVAEWYKQQIGSPEDVVEFTKWKRQQVANAEQAEEAGQISEKQLKAVRDLMRKADPKYAETLERIDQQDQDRADSMLITAEEEVRDLCKGIGFDKKGDEDKINFVARQISLVIRDDEKLFKMWRAGNIKCVKMAFQEVNEKFIKPIRGSQSKNQDLRQSASEKRSVSRLPSLPAGSPALSQKNEKPREKGINKGTHDDAWDLLQSYAKSD